ncbi:MAG: DUF5060 domain-containing protein [Verrucomicrobiales bacterium]|nr:DUF5060 domain-containing protein [Verrucomicrobiales bacterium]
MKSIVHCVAALLLAQQAFLTATAATTAPQWQEVELTFNATRDTANPSIDTEAWADFTHDDGTKLRRPMFWDGDRTFRVRFASTKSSGVWRWQSVSADQDPGLHGRTGELNSSPGRSGAEATLFERHGLPR